MALPQRPRPVPPANSLALLLPLLPLLDAFNHRHRNQHRASRWWASFGLLRRALARLARCLRPLADADAAAASPPEAVVVRATWLRRHVVPAAYIAFSQLAADNQHAPLGLLLLAVLARAHAVLANLEPSQGSSSPPPLTQPPTQPLTVEAHADHGVVVSHQELLRPELLRTELLRPEASVPARPSHHEHVPPEASRQDHRAKTVKPKSNSAKAQDRGKKKHRSDALSSLFRSLS